MKMLKNEEKIAHYYWFILDKIKEQLELKGKKDSSILYTLFLHPALNDPYKPNSTVEQQIISILIEDKIVEETGQRADFKEGGSEYSNPKAAGFHYLLKVNQPGFDELYEKQKELIKQYEITEDRGNTLFFNINGEITYISPIGKEYKTKLNKNTNSYLLLNFLVNQQTNHVFPFSELATKLNQQRGHEKESNNERRVRDTIQSIKKSLNYYEEDLFTSDYGFGIKCNVHIIK